MDTDAFVHQQNVERLRKLLTEAPDHVQRPQILKLLAQEEAKDQPPQPVRRPPS
jgi:hypothetical protein